MAKAPLSGIKVIEFAGLAPGPFAGLILADWGADVIRLDRLSSETVPSDILTRHKRSIAVNLKVRLFLSATDTSWLYQNTWTDP